MTGVAHLRGIDAGSFPKVAAPASFGKPPRLQFIAIRDLVIDPAYQREITAGAGRRNVLRIAEQFDFAKFAPVIVAPAGSNKFAIVDGQHRSTAAALVGLDKVPCAIIDATRAQQAAAFAAINSVVTPMSTLQVHMARVAAGDTAAVALRDACAAGGVSICRYPVPADKMQVGETLAVSQLARLYARFGETVFVAALCAITKTGNGHVGLVRAPIVEALCVNIEAEPGWRGTKLHKAIGVLDLQAMWNKATTDARMSRSKIVTLLVDALGEYLEGAIGAAAA